jgi:hypothetical protein
LYESPPTDEEKADNKEQYSQDVIQEGKMGDDPERKYGDEQGDETQKYRDYARQNGYFSSDHQLFMKGYRFHIR